MDVSDFRNSKIATVLTPVARTFAQQDEFIHKPVTNTLNIFHLTVCRSHLPLTDGVPENINDNYFRPSSRNVVVI